jgi:hypothetical protein
MPGGARKTRRSNGWAGLTNKHDGGMSQIKEDVLLAPLRGDARFATIVRKLRLPE